MILINIILMVVYLIQVSTYGDYIWNISIIGINLIGFSFFYFIFIYIATLKSSMDIVRRREKNLNKKYKNKYFNKIQIRANKGDDILRLQEYYYLINILVNEIKTIKMNYVIRRINYLFSSYNIPKAKGNMIKKEIKRYIELIKSRILNSNFYKELNLIALEIVLEVAEKFNLSLSKAI